MTVQATSVFLGEAAVGEAIWQSFMPIALASGQIRPLLKTVLAGHGLESLQAGIDTVKAGVSASKVVVLLC